MYSRRQTLISLSLSSVLLISSWTVAFTQTPQTPPSAAQDEVLRISTDLVQTDLVVLDKKGKNVKDLTKDQFELLVDGQPQAISFFESVNAGSLKEATQLASGRDQKSGGGTQAAFTPLAGRSFIFLVDDFHLSPEGVQRTTELLNNFVSNMGEDDRALLMSPSGQIGFLQQLTDHKGALKLAISRIKYQSQAATFTTGRRPMTVYEALSIERNQKDIIEYKTREYMDEMGLSRAPTTVRTTQTGPIDPPRAGTDLHGRQQTAELAIKGEARQ
ncbi:MAG TPA: VWA domain-containing protein, partial [Pyrinomonadaceae bacterium]|nr:VWA domain-containing protein [Pyrinomonadaceae bacterium]